MAKFDQYKLSTTRYDWSVKAFSIAKKLLKLNIKLHDPDDLTQSGQIFLFNHFSRFETFIPQYLMHQNTGSYCRSIASPEFFNDDVFARFLSSVGVVPSNMPDLFTFMATEILHGRKLILFPEGGMVKDKRVLDQSGNFSIYSRMALERRKQHRGAAVIALAVDAFKTTLLRDFSKGQYTKIEHWAEQLEFTSTETLLSQAIKPTLIVPANITFYPIRTDSNFLYRLAHKLNDKIDGRFDEELLIESNLLVKNTDMDIHYGQPLNMNSYWYSWEKWALPHAVHNFSSLDELFQLQPKTLTLASKIHSFGMQRKALKVRDDYMKSMYQAVSVHLSHIASHLIILLYRQGIEAINCQIFHKILYLCVKKIQTSHLNYCHRSLKNPKEYGVLLDGGSSRLKRFLMTIKQHDLVAIKDNNYVLNATITKKFDFDQVRTHNIISVYSNEIAPLSHITKIIQDTVDNHQHVTAQELARFRYEDQLIAFNWDKKYYSKSRYKEINDQQTFTQDPNWFFLESCPNAPAVLLVHGLFASPAELRALGDKLHQQGFQVLGVRLKGHGTSPWDLKNTTWRDWLGSVQRGYHILQQFSDDIHVVGFSTGALLALLLAEENKFSSLTSVAAPIKFHDKNAMFISLLHQTNKITGLFNGNGVFPFKENKPEHPDINYQHIPIRALYHLQKLIKKCDQALTINCPIHFIQGDNDPLVTPESLDTLFDHVGNINNIKTWVNADKHGIILDDLDDTQQKIIRWIKGISKAAIAPHQS